MRSKFKKLLLVSAIAATAFAAVACKKTITPTPDDECSHEFTKWDNDENEHWHVCTKCGESQNDVAVHDYGEDGTEDFCICGWENQNAPSILTITYNLYGGSGDPVGAFTEGVGLAELPVPTKAGNDFGGWFDNAEFTGSPVTSIGANVTAPVILHAKWTPKTFTVSKSNNAADTATLTAAGTATYGTDYTFTVTCSDADVPVTVEVTVDGKNYTPTKIGNDYTVAGDAITGDIAIALSIKHVKVQFDTVSNLTFVGDAVAEKNKRFTFAAVAEIGYKITAVTATAGGESVTVTKENDGYSVEVTDKPISISGVVSEIEYTLKFANNKTTATVEQPSKYSYTQSFSIPKASTLDGIVPEHYNFLGWATSPDGEVVYDDEESVSKLATADGVVTLYAKLKGEEYNVSVGALKGFDIVTLDKAEYGEDYKIPLADGTEYLYSAKATVDGTPHDMQVVTTPSGAELVLDKQFVTGAITVSGEKHIIADSFYQDVTPYTIEDSFANNNEYKVYMTLGADGIYFKADIKQNSVLATATDSNIVAKDAIRFVFGKKSGERFDTQNEAGNDNNGYFGVNVVGERQNLDKSIGYYSHVGDGESAYYQIRYEGFISYSKIIALGIGYAESDFAGSAYKTAKVYCGIRLVNHANHTSANDMILTPCALQGYDYNGLQGLLVNPMGANSWFGNTNSITVNGLKSELIKNDLDGVVSQNEYGAHSLVYEDTDTNRNNKFEIFGKKVNGGLKLAVRVTSSKVVYFKDKDGKHDSENVDYIQFGFKNTDGTISHVMLGVDGFLRWMDCDTLFSIGFSSYVKIDKSGAGEFTKDASGFNGANALVAASGGKFVTTYELFIPQEFANRISDELYVRVRHMDTGDTISFDGKLSASSTVWMYGGGNSTSDAWPELMLNIITENGVFDVRRTLVFDNTAAGNNGVTPEPISNAVAHITNLPSVTPVAGYRFKGWSLTNGGEVIADGKLPLGGSIAADGTVTLYAVYESAQWALTLVDESNRASITSGGDNNAVKLNQDLVFTVDRQADTGKTVVVEVKIGETKYDPQISGDTYTVLGVDITDKVTITVREIALESVTVTLPSATENLNVTGEASSYKNIDYEFTVTAASGYVYGLTATVRGEAVSLTDLGNGHYRIAGSLVTGDIVIAEKTRESLQGTPDFEVRGFEYDGVTDESMAAYIDGVKTDAFVFANGKYTVAENALSDVALGQEHELAIETANTVYIQRFFMVTMSVKTTDDFKAIQSKYFKGTKKGVLGSTDTSAYRDGYFVLANDINKDGDAFYFTMAPIAYPNDGHGAALEGDEAKRASWYGTIDGRGHAVYNVTAGYGGMFGMLPETSIIKNIAFINCKSDNSADAGELLYNNATKYKDSWQEGMAAKPQNNDGANSGFLTRSLSGGTVENVYIEMAEMPAFNRYGVLAFVAQKNSVIRNVVINVKTSAGSADDRHSFFGIAWGQSIENCFVYGATRTVNAQDTNDLPSLSRSSLNGLTGNAGDMTESFAVGISGKGSFVYTENVLKFYETAIWMKPTE
ncbi:MAG: InlB B-repeat-containing protein [Clostridiales bacterium]|nr:InlB B-repeat-containing protein [Clostridiales bacterium]